MTGLDKIISCIYNKNVYIQTHNFPDPDAVACAYAMQELLKVKGVQSEICYKGNIDRTVVASMVRELGIPMTEYPDEFGPEETDEIILVDAQKGNSNIIDMRGNEVICIDHHLIHRNEQYRYADIRPEVGACSSIIASYYFENDVDMSVNVATALLFGIKVDTADLKRGVSQLDLEMFVKLHRIANHALIGKFESNIIHFEDLKAYNEALETLQMCENVCFADAGADCKESVIASIADFVLQLDGIDLVVVYSLRNDGIKISVRSSGKYKCGNIIIKALEGIGSGGGHERMAGGFIPFKESFDSKSKEELTHELKCRFLEQVDIRD
ncbi:MAG: bifunctional oligoribonuclease/PAP phosphatase NrnA [Lachnospira sp.]